MTSLSAFFVDFAAVWNAWAPVLASTLLHFVWQGALLGLAAVAILRLAKLGPTTRYAVGVATLALMLAAPAATFFALSGRQLAATPLAQSLGAPGDFEAAPAGPSLAGMPAAATGLLAGGAGEIVSPVWTVERTTGRARLELVIAGIWFLGVFILSIRLLGGWVVARRLARRSVRPVSRELESLARRIAGRLALDRVVRIAESPAVAVPVLVGWLKPVVLLPASALSGLTPTQIEALLAHELAHVRRHDYVVNLLQSVVETLLFYHPAVWWVSREVRREREHCCDDVAVGVCDRVEYVTALANLAAMTSVPRTALAATDGSLVWRVRRLLVPSSDDRRSSLVGWIAVSAVVLGVVLVGASVSSAGATLEPGDQAAPSAVGSPVQMPGVSGGIPGGVTGGVPGGVTGGVALAEPGTTSQNPPPPPGRVRPVPPSPPPTGVPAAPPSPRAVAAGQVDEQAARERERRDMERAMREVQQQMMEAQKEIDMKRLELELQRAQLEMQVQLEMAKSQIEVLSRQMEKTKEMVSVGLASPEALAQTEMELAAAKRQLRMAEVELEMRKADIDLRRREAETRLQYEHRLLELEMAQVESERARTADVERAREAAVGAAVRAGRATVEAAAPRPGREMEVVMPGMTEPLPAHEPARAGDVVQIQIAGEPQLPRNYEVSVDGSIRIPLMGSIRVQGLTASQIRDELTRQLAARGLKENASVGVTIRR